MPCASAARAFSLTRSSSSPNIARRSECPITTQRTPHSTSIGGEISPVNAPASVQHTFCAPSPTALPASASRTAHSAVNGGAITASTAASGSGSSRSAATNARACAIVLFIFQLPTMSGLRCGVHAARARDARQRLAFEELERRAAAGRDVRHRVGEPERVRGRRRVAAADDADRAVARRLGDRFADDARAVSGTARFSYTPIGPLNTIVFAARSTSA